MLSTFVQFCIQWIGTDPLWPKIILILIVILVLVGPRRVITIKKKDNNKWTIFF